MINEYKLDIYKNQKPIVVKYIENDFTITDTDIQLYDGYKLNIMLSDGLAAVLSERNDIYNTVCGDLLFFCPTELHHGRFLRQGIHKYIEVIIPTELFANSKALFSLFSKNETEQHNYLSPVPQKRKEILEIAEKIIDKISDNSKSDDIHLLSDLILLISICSEQVTAQKQNLSIPATLEKAISFIMKKYSERINIAEIARFANCSPSYLNRIFKKHIGRSPHDYLTEYRLFKAEKLLRHGSSITDVAILCGFCDSSVFIKCFKKAFGITPLKYQNNHKLHNNKTQGD